MKRLVLLCLLAIGLATAQEWVYVFGDDPGSLWQWPIYGLSINRQGNVFVSGSSEFIEASRFDQSGLVWNHAHPGGARSGLGQPRVAAGNNAVCVSGAGFYNSRYNMYMMGLNLDGDSLWWWDYTPGYGFEVSPLNDVAVDAQGNAYAVASFAQSNWDIVAAKVSATGQQVWLNTYSDTHGGADIGQAIVVDDSGFAYVAGQADNTLGRVKPVLLKYRGQGAPDWVRLFGQDSIHNGSYYGLALGPSSTIYAVGYHATGPRSALAKYTLHGDSLWNVTRDNVKLEHAAVDASGNLFAAGVDTGNNVDIVVCKTTSSGSSGWEYRYDGPAHGSDVANCLTTDRFGNVIVTGKSMGDSGQEMVTIKLTPTGSLMWVARYSRGYPSQGSKVVADSLGNIYVTGLGYCMTGHLHTLGVVLMYPPSGPGVSEQGEVGVMPALRVSPTVTRAGCRVNATGSIGDVVVMDAAGRTVRTLAVRPGGGGEFVWDGCGSDGRLVPGGVYFVVAQTETGRTAAKVIVQH